MTTTMTDIQATISNVNAKLSLIEGNVLTQSKALTSQQILTLHKILNTLALQAADYLNMSSGTFGGSQGAYHEDTGGTDKGG